MFVLRALTLPKRYTSLATFIPDQQGDAPGLDMGNPASFITNSLIMGNSVEITQILGVLNSRRLRESVVSDSITYKDKRELVADLIIEKQLETNMYAVISYAIFGKPQKLTLTNKINASANYLKSKLVASVNDFGYINMTFTFYDKEVVQQLSLLFLDKLIIYYKEQKTEKTKQSVEFLKVRLDSLNNEYKAISSQIATINERNRYNQDYHLEMRKRDLDFQYELIVRLVMETNMTLDQARNQLEKDIPIIQVLDEPKPPFTKSKPNLIVHGISGLILGAILMALWISRNYVKEDVVVILRSSLDGDS